MCPTHYFMGGDEVLDKPMKDEAGKHVVALWKKIPISDGWSTG